MGRTSDADERLKAAALDLIWEGSYGTVTIEQICQKANVKKGSFYYFFKSKADLTVASIEQLWSEKWKPRLDETFSPSVDPIARLTGYLDFIYGSNLASKARFGKMVGCPVCSIGSEVSTQEADVSAAVRGLLSRKRRYLESAIRDALAQGVIEHCEPVQAAQAMEALVDGLISQSRIMNDPEILRRLPAMVFDLLRVRKATEARESETLAKT
jgi:TetR/AcrR family transcriptional repressor of nem operon